MVEAASMFRKNGFNDSDAATLAKTATMFQNVSDEAISAGDSASFIISQMIAFGIEAENAQSIIDKVNETANKFSVSSGDLSKALGIVASTSSAMGNSIDQTLGVVTAITEQTRNASKSARAANTIFSRLAQVVDENSDTGKRLTEIYNNLGIALYDSSGQMRSTYDILADLASQWGSLDKNTQQYIAITSAGTNQLNNFLALMNNFDHAAEATATSINSAGSAMRENEAFQESLEYQTNNLKATFQDFANNVLDKQVITIVLKASDAFLQLANTGIGQLVTKIGLLAGTGWGLSSLIHVSKIIPVIVGQFKNFGAVLSLVAEGSGTFGAALSAAGGAGAVALPIFLAVSAAIVGIVEAVKAYKESHPDFDTAVQSVSTLSDSLKTAQDRLDEINKLGWKDRTRAINEEEQELKDLIEQQERELRVAEMRQAMAAGDELSERTGYGQATRYTAISPNDADNQTFASMDEAVKFLAETEGITGESTDELKQKLLDLGYAFVTTTENTKLTADEMNALDTQALQELSASIKENGELNTYLKDSYQGLYEELAPTYEKLVNLENAQRNAIPGARELTDSERELKDAFEQLVGTMLSFESSGDNAYQTIVNLANILGVTPAYARELAISMGLIDANTRPAAGALVQLENGTWAVADGLNAVKTASYGVVEAISNISVATYDTSTATAKLTASLFDVNGNLTTAATTALQGSMAMQKMATSELQAQQAAAQANFENLIKQINAVSSSAIIASQQLSTMMALAGVSTGGASASTSSANLQRTYKDLTGKTAQSDIVAYNQWVQSYLLGKGSSYYDTIQKETQDKLDQITKAIGTGGGGGGSSSTKRDQEEVKAQTINTIEELREYLTNEETRLKLIDPDISKSDLQSTLSEVATIYKSYQDYLSQLKQQGFDETSDKYKEAEAEFAKFLAVLEELFMQIAKKGNFTIEELFQKFQSAIGEASTTLDKFGSKSSNANATKGTRYRDPAGATIREMRRSIENQYETAVQNAIKNADAESAVAEEVADEYDRQNRLLEDKIALEEKLEALEKAKQRRMLVYSEGRFQYMQDADAISSAQKDYQETYRGIEQSQTKELMSMLGDESKAFFENYFSNPNNDVLNYPDALRKHMLQYVQGQISGTVYEGMSEEGLYNTFGEAMKPGDAYNQVLIAYQQAERAREVMRQMEADLKKKALEESVRSYGVNTDFGEKIKNAQSQAEAAHWTELRDAKQQMIREYRELYGDEAASKYFGTDVSKQDTWKSNEDLYKEAWENQTDAWRTKPEEFVQDELGYVDLGNSPAAILGGYKKIPADLLAAEYNVADALDFEGLADRELYHKLFSQLLTKDEVQELYDKAQYDITKGNLLNYASEMKKLGVKGYARGTRHANNGLSLVGENGPELRVLNHGDGILPNNITDNLWRWGSMTPADMLASLAQRVQNWAQTLNISNVTLPNVRDAQSFVTGLRELAQQYVTRRS